MLLELFDASETMLSIGTTALRIIGTHFLIAGINVVAMSVYQAVGDPLYSLLSSVTRQLVVLLPAAWLLARTGRLELVLSLIHISLDVSRRAVSPARAESCARRSSGRRLPKMFS